MKLKDFLEIRQAWQLRWAMLGMFYLLCWLIPSLSFPKEFFSFNFYPSTSFGLSWLSSLFPFSLDELFVTGALIFLIAYPFVARLKYRKTWRKCIAIELEAVAWLVFWFYLGWGGNYRRDDFYTRMCVPPLNQRDSTLLNVFAERFIHDMNKTYVASQGATSSDREDVERLIKQQFENVPIYTGMTKPQRFQHIKTPLFTGLYSRVGVLGFMGPFFCEAHVTRDVPPVQYPFTCAHEWSHLLSISSEAEANYWAYYTCLRTADPSVRYSGYFGILPYLLKECKRTLSPQLYERRVKEIRPEIRRQAEETNRYWAMRYDSSFGKVQHTLYDLYLKGNDIPSGTGNYSEVVGMLLSVFKVDYDAEQEEKRIREAWEKAFRDRTTPIPNHEGLIVYTR